MRICVFCGSNPGRLPIYREAAAAFGTLLAQQGIGIVFGGTWIGMMGAVADAALAAGGEVIGVIPKALHDREIAHSGLTELHVVASMHARKSLMAELSDASVALPGGTGTLEEIMEVWAWGQLGNHARPVGLLNAGGFFDRLLSFFDHSQQEGFMRLEHRRMLLSAATPAALLRELQHYRAPLNTGWFDRVPVVAPTQAA